MTEDRKQRNRLDAQQQREEIWNQTAREPDVEPIQGDSDSGADDTGDLEIVEFCDTELQCVQKSTDVWISLKRVCEGIGIDESSQRKKLEGKTWATTQLLTAVAPDGKQRRMNMIHLDQLPMFLATIDENRVAAEVKPTLIKFQTEATQVLRDHFFGEPQQREPGDTIDLDSVGSMDPTEAFGRLVRHKEELAERTNCINEILAEDVLPRRLEQDRRRYLQQAGLPASTPTTPTATLVSSDDNVVSLPPVTDRTDFNTLVRRAAYLKYGDNPTNQQFAWMMSSVYRDFRNRFSIDLKKRASNNDMTPIEYAEQEGHLDDLLAVARTAKDSLLS